MPLRNFVGIALAVIISAACFFASPKNRYAILFAEALQVVDREALEVVGRRALFDAAIDGMLGTLDENSEYFSGQNFTAFDENLHQQFGGVGMYVAVDPKTTELVVLAAMPNTPAAKAGLQSGDAILAIDGQSTTGKSREDAIKLMRGLKGVPVTLQVRHLGEIRDVILLRDFIKVDSVHGDWLNSDGSWDFVLRDQPRIGYVRVSQFGDRTADEFRAAIQKMNGRVDCLIVDLRLNSGGLLDSAVNICSMFLPIGKMVVEIRSRSEGNDEINTNESAIFPADMPVVVLINRHSASASEIVAACLQDHGRATIIGERSYGKGTVQNVIPLERGRSAIKLTTASYWRPNGVNIDKHHSARNNLEQWGVSPDPGFGFELTEEDIFQEARHRNARDLEGIRNGATTPVEDPAVEVSPTGDDVPTKPFVDLPMQKAIEFLLSKIGKPIAT